MNKSNKKMYLDIHYLRGLAILFIVWGHLRASLYLQGKVSFDETWVIFEHYRAIIVDGGTPLFVFISGFLFSKIYVEKNINYFDFFIKKAKTVLLPFLLVTTPFVLYSVSRQSNWGFSYESVYMKGYAWLAYWYIPFVMVLFAASPFYSLFTKLQTKYQLVFFLVAAFISIGFGRYDHNVFLSLIFLE